MNRVDYKTLKKWFFYDAYIWCQRKFEDGKIIKWNKNFSEWGGALDSFDGHFNLPIEKLMISVIYVILNGARHPYSHKLVMEEIDHIILSNNLDELISILEEKERKEFLYDLNLVLNNRKVEE